jgi:hypothetical protein
MIGILMAVVVLVGVVAGADLLLSFAVVRRLAVLESRVPVAAGGGPFVPPVGHQVGDFRVQLLTGGELSRADLAGRAVMVIFVSPSCKPCQQAIADLGTLPVPLPSPLYVLIGGFDQASDASGMLDDLPPGVHAGAVLPDDSCNEAFGIDSYPTALAIEDGVVRANELRVSGLLDSVSR